MATKKVEKIGFMSACRTYFGMKPGQTLSQFAQEIKELSDEDRAYFKKLFPTVGIEIE